MKKYTAMADKAVFKWCDKRHCTMLGVLFLIVEFMVWAGGDLSIIACEVTLGHFN